ncbi:MAG: hypothetical protein V5A19_14190, partial [Thiohalorhabdus sp.]
MTSSGKMRWPARLGLAAVLAALVGLAAWGVISRKAELAAAPRFEAAPAAVHTVTADSATLERTRRYLAEAEAVRAADVAARITERVTAVAVDEGDTVAEGDALVGLDASQVAARL